jgi:hypothetical protein
MVAFIDNFIYDRAQPKWRHGKPDSVKPRTDTIPTIDIAFSVFTHALRHVKP